MQHAASQLRDGGEEEEEEASHRTVVGERGGDEVAPMRRESGRRREHFRQSWVHSVSWTARWVPGARWPELLEIIKSALIVAPPHLIRHHDRRAHRSCLLLLCLPRAGRMPGRLVRIARRPVHRLTDESATHWERAELCGPEA